jgi:hypothetical protein
MTPSANTPQLLKKTASIWVCGMAGICLAIALLVMPAPASAGGWNVAVGVSGGNGYRPIAYGPGYGAPYGPGFRRGYWNGGPYGYGGWGTGWNAAWGNGWGYPAYPVGYPYAFSSPPAVYVQPIVVEPIVLAAQSQPPVWYFCASAAQYFPNVGTCPEGWQVQSAVPPPQTQSQQKSSHPARTN